MLPWHPLFYVFLQTSSEQPFKKFRKVPLACLHHVTVSPANFAAPFLYTRKICEHAAVLQAMNPVQQARLDVLAHPGNFDIIALLHQLTLQPTSSMPAWATADSARCNSACMSPVVL